MAASSSVKDTTKRLTSGSPMSLILGFSLPLLVGMLFQQFYSLVDTRIVGRISRGKRPGGGGLHRLRQLPINGFCMGVSRALPSGGPAVRRRGRERSAAGMWAAASLALRGIRRDRDRDRQRLLPGNPDPHADAGGHHRRRLRLYLHHFVGIPVTYLYNLTSGIIRSLGDSKTPVYFLLMASALNIVLDILFITRLTPASRERPMPRLSPSWSPASPA